MIALARHHQEQLEQYEQVLQLKRPAPRVEQEQADFFAFGEVLFQYVIAYERNYLAWCQSMLQYLEQQQHGQAGEQS